ncbi:uncharacterized protein LOC126901550 [Daktulosphaira vitifoliae]|uniref:uncharacterized protein LOC126901550 n=1 Tax=Daktulosphaira vitifoliae TaxID=58002 RepID=UPI0021A9D73B|nr:uncharacterized protein LOC126901550 [Daktulosphaira vitifoliae]
MDGLTTIIKRSRSMKYRIAVFMFVTASSLAMVSAFIDNTKSQRYWDDYFKPEEAVHIPNNHIKSYIYKGGNRHFVTPVFPEMDARGFHEYLFDGLQPDLQWPPIKFKRNFYPQGITARGFSDDILHQSFGLFEPLKRSVSRTSLSVSNLLRRLNPNSTGLPTATKRRPEMDATGFHGDSFTGGMDRFDTMKRGSEMDTTGFHGDSFTGGMDRFDTMKRGIEMDATGFHGDSFSEGMDRFDTMKRRPEMDATGFHSDSFTNGMDRFDTMKRRSEMDATGFEGDSFTAFGRFETMRKKKANRPPTSTQYTKSHS